jgi:hypothetical protein
MNHKQCPEIIRLKKKLKVVPKSEFYMLAKEVGINDEERDMLIDKYCLGRMNTAISIKYNIDESSVSDVLNRNLQKICFYIHATQRRIEDYSTIFEKNAKI